jgi:HlyD family secretion protein
MDTERLDNETAKLEKQIAAAEDELRELVRLGELMVAQFHSAKAKAQAELTKAEDDWRRAKNEQGSQAREARAALTIAADRFRRVQGLVASQFVTTEEFVEAQSQLQQAQEKLNQAQLPLEGGQVAVLRRALEQVDKDFAVGQAELETRKVAKRGESATARKELANLQLERTRSVLYSPIDGIVVSGHVKQGDVLELGKPVFEIARQEGFRFEATVPSEEVGRLAVGMPAKIKFDAFDFQKYGTLDGVLSFIAPDSQVSKGDTSASGPISYVVRIELHGDHVGRGDLRGNVKLGLGGTVEIVTQCESLLAILVKKLRGTISLV